MSAKAEGDEKLGGPDADAKAAFEEMCRDMMSGQAPECCRPMMEMFRPMMQSMMARWMAASRTANTPGCC